LCFFATAADARGRAAVSAALALKHFFDDAFASFFGVTIDPTDEAQQRVASTCQTVVASETSWVP
jgi:hypothetical protein